MDLEFSTAFQHVVPHDTLHFNMKITVLQENILKSCQDALKFVSTRPQLPVLSCFLIQAKKEGITLSATDLNMGIQVSFGGKVEEPGEIVVPAKLFLDVLSTLGKENVLISSNEESVVVSSSKSQTTIQGMSPKDFPIFPKVENAAFSMKKEEFVDIVNRVAVASGIDETRPIFTSMLWDFSGSSHFACSDGYRMSYLKSEKEFDGGKVLIPAKLLLEVSRILSHGVSHDVEISIPKELKQVTFSFGSTSIFTRIIEGSFPDFENILPKSFAIERVFQKEDLARAVKSALIFAKDSSGIVKWSVEKNKTVISSSSSVLGNHETTLDSKDLRGGEGIIAFNGKYILDFLSTVEGQEVWFGMNESLQPGEFRDFDVKNFRYLIMPFRVQS